MGQVLKTVWLDMIRVLSIMVTFCQIATALTNLPQLQWPRNFIVYLDTIDFVNLDFLDITGLACGVQITVSYVSFLIKTASLSSRALIRLRVHFIHICYFPQHARKVQFAVAVIAGLFGGAALVYCVLRIKGARHGQ